MNLTIREAYYNAGIGVLARKLNIGLRQLTIGFEHQYFSGPKLEGLQELSLADVAFSASGRQEIEDYLTVCLGGIAGEQIYVLANRRQLHWAQGDAAYLWKFWRRTQECGDPEVDRAFAIAMAYLRNYDLGDPNATVWRLWQRAVNLLQQLPQREQLDRLAKQLLFVGKLSGDEVFLILDQ